MKTIGMKSIGTLLVVLGMGLTSCEKDPEMGPDYNTRIMAKAGFNAGAAKKSLASYNISLESFTIVVEEIEFEFDDDDKNGRDNDYASDIELKGPFVIDLMDNGKSLEQLLATVILPEGRYKEIEFEIEKGKVPGSPMFGKSIQATGTINGTPFTFWTDETDDFEVEFEGSNVLTVDGVKEAIVTIYLDLSRMFDPAMGGMYFGELMDKDGDGEIEINPFSDDDYSSLSDDLWELFDDALDAYDDYDDFDDDDDDDDDEDDDDDD
ncbi:MAG: DUF4382 domain-containing protein [Burkholderiaceae bacterium]|nr:DUF4382 domain-containing protein [Burkholderiaceae bacterium]